MAARRYIARTGSRELFTLAVLVVALGIAVGAAKLFGVSMELGAFLAGMVVGRSEFSTRAATDALPMKDAFAVLFFVSVGMLFDFQSLLDTPGLVLATLAIVIVGKPLAAIVITVLLRLSARHRAGRRGGAGADRRVLLHRRHHGQQYWAGLETRPSTPSSPRRSSPSP